MTAPDPDYRDHDDRQEEAIRVTCARCGRVVDLTRPSVGDGFFAWYVCWTCRRAQAQQSAETTER